VDGYGVVTVSKDSSEKITVSFLYDFQLVGKVKPIEGRKWHPDKKYWSFLKTDATLKNWHFCSKSRRPEVGYLKQVRIQSTLGRTKNEIGSLVNKLNKISGMKRKKFIKIESLF
jgi:hypothetical protein